MIYLNGFGVGLIFAGGKYVGEGRLALGLVITGVGFACSATSFFYYRWKVVG